MSQAAFPSDTYLNSNLFSGYYPDERVADLDAWDCDDEAQAALEQLQATYNQEGGLLPPYKEDVLSKCIDEALDVLGFDSPEQDKRYSRSWRNRPNTLCI